MSIGQKIISGFLLAVLLVGGVGYFGLQVASNVQQSFELETRVSSLLSDIAEKGTVTFAATFTKNIEELEVLRAEADRLNEETNKSIVELEKNTAVRGRADFRTFIDTIKKHNADQEKIFELHEELLTREGLFGASPEVEETVRKRLRQLVEETGSFILLESFADVVRQSQQAIFRYKSKEAARAWLEAVRELRADAERYSAGSRLLNQITVYEDAAEIVTDVVVREKEIRSQEADVIAQMREREAVLADLRQGIATSFLEGASRESENGRAALILAVIIALAVAVGAGVFIARFISTPIRELTRAAREAAQGNLNTRASVSTNDETGVLAEAFNKMVAQLAAYPKKLEKQVAEQTEHLNKANERLQELLDESDRSAKMLVKKDRELVATNESLIDLNEDLEDVTKMLVKRDRELTQSNERLRELDEVKSQFVSVAAHQLRTPLTGIKWSLHALLTEGDETLSQDQQKLARDTFGTTLRLIDLVNDLLNVSRLESGRFGFEFKRMPLEPLIRSLRDRFGSIAEEKNVGLSLTLPEEELPEVYIDEEKAGIVLNNMFDNAIKYTKPGGSVSCTVTRSDDNIVVRVADTGIGIPKEQLHHVFKRFFRARNAQLYHTSGTGLGLYLSKNIMKQHGGGMRIESEEMKGTTIEAVFPIPSEK